MAKNPATEPQMTAALAMVAEASKYGLTSPTTAMLWAALIAAQKAAGTLEPLGCDSKEDGRSFVSSPSIVAAGSKILGDHGLALVLIGGFIESPPVKSVTTLTTTVQFWLIFGAPPVAEWARWPRSRAFPWGTDVSKSQAGAETVLHARVVRELLPTLRLATEDGPPPSVARDLADAERWEAERQEREGFGPPITGYEGLVSKDAPFMPAPQPPPLPQEGPRVREPDLEGAAKP